MKNMQICTVRIIQLGTVIFALLVLSAAILMLVTDMLEDSLTAFSYTQELLVTAQKITIMTAFCAFVSDFLTGRREDEKN